MSLYKEILLDHYKNPRHHGKIANALFAITEHNPLCGDLIQITGIVCNGKLEQVAFVGKGCVISQATASILLEKYKSSEILQILACTSDDVHALIQMELGPNRLKCALLPLIALKKGLLTV